MIIEIPDDNSIVKWKKNDNEDWKSAEILDLIKALEERPTGEWIVTQEGRWLYPVCSLCGGKQDVKSNYCPDCGAKMKKETENE